MIGGALVGAIAIVFPQILGVGYETIEATLHGEGVIWVLAALVVVKIVAAGTTLGSGGSGGVFAPALFVGACLGGAFGLGVDELMPGRTGGAGAYALVGMGAVLAGATHAPITAIIMLFELTSNYTIILPLMLSCIISVVLAGELFPTSIFTTRLKRRGVRLRGSAESELMRNTKVRRLLRPFPECLQPQAPIKDVMEKALVSSLAHQYVVNEERRLLGVITLRRLKMIFMEDGFDNQLVVAADVMKSPVTAVALDDTLDLVMSHLSRLDVEMLPVVGKDDELVGCITRHDMMAFFEHEILKDEALGLKFVPEDNPEDSKFIEVPEGHMVATIEVTRFIDGQSLKDLDLRATAGINVLGIRRRTAEGIERLAPDPAVPLKVGDFLIAVGEDRAISSFEKAIAAS